MFFHKYLGVEANTKFAVIQETLTHYYIGANKIKIKKSLENDKYIIGDIFANINNTDTDSEGGL
jgi:hypothetical protein